MKRITDSLRNRQLIVAIVVIVVVLATIGWWAGREAADRSAQPSLHGAKPSGMAPGGVLDLSDWKLTLPLTKVNDPSNPNPREVTQPDLSSFVLDPFFVGLTDQNGQGVQFRAYVDGKTTTGSRFPRSELREMTDGGQKQASWSSTSGRHVMTLREAITHLPDVKAQTVSAQIHNATDDVIEILADGTQRNSDGSIRVCVRFNSKTQPDCLDDHYQLGTAFDLQIVVENGRIAISYNGTPKATFDYQGSGLYFKAGDYTQSNLSKGDPASSYGEVVVYKLSVSHS